MKKIFLLLVVFCYISGMAQSDMFLAEIPETLKKNAGVVKRNEEIIFDVTDVDRATYSVHQVYTVLNETGRDALIFYEFSNKAVTLDDVEIKMYDLFGKVINKVKKKDIYKQADMSGVASDNVYYIHELKPVSYPVTVEYNYKVNYTGTLWYPDYDIMSRNESVQSSSFVAKVPIDIDLRYKEYQIAIKPTIANDGKYKTYKWSVNDMPAIKYDEGSIAYNYYFPSIKLAPNKFRIYNTMGSMTSWKEFGEWEKKLHDGLEVLSDERKAFFAEMTKDAPDDRTKVAIVYNYLQQNFRYVSIQLGIGGWKSFPAKFTDEKKYGDCKALSFYMYSVLKSVGVRSHIAIINSGYNLPSADPAFPINQFNHVILCVPQKKDSIWLECTSQVIDFDYLSSSTENRNALLVTDNGGVLVSTPASDPMKNHISSFTTITLEKDGSGEVKTKLVSAGSLRMLLHELSTQKLDDQKEAIVNELGFKQPDEFRFVQKTSKDYELDMIIEKIPEFSAGSKMFLRQRINQLVSAALPTADNRTHDYYFKSAKSITDTTVYNLPEGYIMDVLPRKTVIENDFVKYQTSFWYDENSKKVYSAYTYCIKKNKIPVEKYAEVKKSFDEIVSDGTQKIVIKRS